MDARYLIKIAVLAALIVVFACFSTLYLLSGNEVVVTRTVEEVDASPIATSTAEKVRDTSEADDLSATPAPAPDAPKLETFKLNVPYYAQQYFNSCEAASLRMALGFYNINVTDMDLVNAFGYDPRSKDTQNNIWDDPQKMFVGFIDIASSTGGYGVYGKPVARVAEAYGRTAEYRTTMTPQIMAAEIRAGHPVVMWGYSSLQFGSYTWNLASGGTVQAFHGEHVRTIVGVYGDPKEPTGFFVHDPMVGPYVYWSTATLMRQFNAVPGVTNQAVIVK